MSVRSSFFEYNVAVSGLFTSRAALQTVSHNVSNASTPGYSRQVAKVRTTTPLTYYNGRGMIGTGSEAYGVTQIRNFYVDKKYWAKMGTLGEYSVKRTQLMLTQTVLSEVEGTGLSTIFNGFFESIQDLITTTGDITYRTNVLQSADSLCTFIRDAYESFLTQQRDINEEIRAVVTTVNSLGTQICELNKKIKVLEADGSEANDLRDQRALLVDELSRYVNVDVREIEPNPGDKRFVVQINGQDFVNNFDFRGLSVRERTDVDENGNIISIYRNPEDNSGLYDIYWGDSDNKFNIYHENFSGELKGLIDLRDGNNGNFAKALAAAGAYDSATGKLTLSLTSASRLDLSAAGVISVTDSNGRVHELAYSKYEYDALGNAVFTLSESGRKTADALDARGIDPVAAGSTVRIGSTNDYKGIPYYLSRLNTLVRTFATAVNFGKKLDGSQIAGVIGHVNGYDVDGNQDATLFFTYMDGLDELTDAGLFDAYKITAKNFMVNTELLGNPRKVNGSDEETGGIDNNKVLRSFLNINTDNSLFSEGKLLDYIISVTGELGIDVKQAENFENSYTSVTTMIDNQRLSISGVNINEEIVDMIRYNQQYQACARLMNIIDGIYDTLVNRLGLL